MKNKKVTCNECIHFETGNEFGHDVLQCMYQPDIQYSPSSTKMVSTRDFNEQNKNNDCKFYSSSTKYCFVIFLIALLLTILFFWGLIGLVSVAV